MDQFSYLVSLDKWEGHLRRVGSTGWIVLVCLLCSFVTTGRKDFTREQTLYSLSNCCNSVFILIAMAPTVSGKILEEESAVQLNLVEILTRTDESSSVDAVTDDQETDFWTVIGYLSTHSSSSIIVKLACQTLEKVDILFLSILFYPFTFLLVNSCERLRFFFYSYLSQWQFCILYRFDSLYLFSLFLQAIWNISIFLGVIVASDIYKMNTG